VSDFLDRDRLLSLGLDSTTVDRLLRDSPLTGDGGRPVAEAARLPDLLGLLRRAARGLGPDAGSERGEA
jgi:hypothetical protein